jgi:hypothetical protein
MLVTIREFGDMSEALMARGCLDAAGIAAFLADTNIARLDWGITRGIRLQVDENDAPGAIALLSERAGDLWMENYSGWDASPAAEEIAQSGVDGSEKTIHIVRAHE